MEKSQPQILCAKEALDLLNCVTDPNFDQEKCIRLLNSLRNCVLQKKVKKFTLDETNSSKAATNVKEKQ
ncbi:Cysteine alpha-hairpin motif superfamily [Cinnamomum micranthum f. kanehirae]|uniref:Cysteine alpha-hairpin motif superfamily n=1 Tax=Cinnamomum micranthum f. kanehirae TaxID=337451 RepID=A0A3S3NS04_9MAGN|nr:Cysteine alpha-hairpin motif superfamily [Cinnamomum micranthum f. kanehirae]